MSAPARRIAVSDSIAAPRSSIQPLAAAAFSIEYSPETWYAATGAPVVLHPPDDVEVGQRGLHHQDVGALLEVELRLADRLVGVGRIHLIAAAVAELGVDPAASRNGP